MKEFIEKLIEKLKKELIALEDNFGDYVECIPSEVVFEIINQLAEEHNNGWIPCSERLPDEKVYDDGYVEPSDDVLVYTRYGNRKVSRYWGNRRNKRDYYDWVDIKCRKNEVLAWMPLPAPYIEKEDKQK